MLKTLLTAVLLLSAFTNILHTQAQGTTLECPQPGSLTTRLIEADYARVLPPNVMNLRQQPGTQAALLGQIPAGGAFAILDGPHCTGGYVWWQVDYAGMVGWTAEGSADEYWLEPILPVVRVVSDTDFVEPGSCLEPPDDYTRIRIGSADFNARTLAMLDYAQQLYGGVVNFRQAITQGGYTGGIEPASFGTHDGGGAVDLSVRSRADFSVLTDEIPLMLHALRTAGFAAWLREAGELYPGSPIHIHAIAVGDLELSEAARAQIDGPFGYLRGYDGLPQEDGIPRPDRSGEMIVCQWMLDRGFSDLRGQPYSGS